jgi:hypothetical protein
MGLHAGWFADTVRKRLPCDQEGTGFDRGDGWSDDRALGIWLSALAALLAPLAGSSDRELVPALARADPAGRSSIAGARRVDRLPHAVT